MLVIDPAVVPTFPLMVELVQVTVPEVGTEFVPRTTKLLAVPSDGATAWASAEAEDRRNAANPAVANKLENVRLIFNIPPAELLAEVCKAKKDSDDRNPSARSLQRLPPSGTVPDRLRNRSSVG
ncbi:MAG: hypothetical protein ACXWBL_03795 [Usitatibacter sp.]